MTFRGSLFVILASFAAVSLAQSRNQQSSKTESLAPIAGATRVVRGTFNTQSVFPQVSSSILQKTIRPSNPTRGLTILSVGDPTFFDNAPPLAWSTTPGPKFPGIDFAGWIPPDPDLAVGPNDIVQVVNTEIAFFTKAGTKTFQQNAATFFTSVKEASGNQTFDPKVMYDRLANRFVIVFLEQDGSPQISNALLAVSDDSNPAGTWHLYRIDAKRTVGGQLHWLDYPGFGYNKDGYVINGNLFRFSGGNFGGVEFIVVPKVPVLTGAAMTPAYFVDTGAGSAQMAETIDATKDTVFGAARTFTNQTRFYGVRSLGTVPTLNMVDVTVTNVPTPPSTVSTTNGQVLDTVGARIFTAIWRAGILYLSYNVGVSASIAGSHWAEYNTANWPVSGSISETQQGNVTNPTINIFMPAVDVNKHGDVSMLFTRCNSTITADIAVAGRISTDPSGSMSAPNILISSIGNNYSQFRWGDYFGVDVDPADEETFWGTGMVVRGDNLWSTHIFSWNVSKTTFLPPATHSWFRGAPQSGNTASLAADDDNYLVARAGLVLFPAEPPAQLVVEATAPSGQVLNIDMLAVAKVNTPGLGQRLQLFNWTTGSYEQVGTDQSSTTTDSAHNGSATGTLSRFVQTGTGLVRARIQFFRTGLTLVWPWTVSVDQVRFAIRTR